MNIAIMGHGVVGSAVAQLLLANSDKVSHSAGEKVELSAVLDLKFSDGLPYSNLFTNSFEDILENDKIGVVVECMGGTEPAYSFVSKLLSKSKAVVTSNKELIAKHGYELIELAKKHGTNIFFEASVGGGIPIIKPLHDCLGANHIECLRGILNGTTNFILTEMFENNLSFDEALQLAQKLGYAERDPSADVDGHDAARKLAIVSSMAYGKSVDYSAIPCRGIRDVKLEDVQLAKDMGYSIKLIARSSMAKGVLSAQVSPCLVNVSADMLGGVRGVFNALSVTGDAVGEVVMYGRGAGGLATASAILSDVIDATKAKGHIHTIGWGRESIVPLAEDSLEDNFFVRFNKADRNKLGNLTLIASAENASDIAVITGKLQYAKLKAAFENMGISIKQCMPCLYTEA